MAPWMVHAKVGLVAKEEVVGVVGVLGVGWGWGVEGVGVVGVGVVVVGVGVGVGVVGLVGVGGGSVKQAGHMKSTKSMVSSMLVDLSDCQELSL